MRRPLGINNRWHSGFARWRTALLRRDKPEHHTDVPPPPHSTPHSVAQRSRYALRLLRREWLPDVLEALTPGPRQYGELLKDVRSNGNSAQTAQNSSRRYLQESVLTRTLTKMRELDLIDKDRETDFPYHTTYRITSAGQELLDALVPLMHWAERHTPPHPTPPDDGPE
ncbi:winged helix-turn-helix transcriptional regulator [Streptomyces endophyticus]|uniref:Winged helix-turn-helix transcriptional regulator n=1 Tax=Streptomyces endophyticus TaxID=714166 RepID=A0ABU6F2J2_9ACTN|nr:winged helix-turn-helix transcriptional regulator [Streptomyces endophyticus]MEB8338059.1 winged helix-turn-helix transcriptional regulator [Streptomyces endophyticus]